MNDLEKCKTCGVSLLGHFKYRPFCVQYIGFIKLKQTWWNKIFSVEFTYDAIEYSLLIFTNYIFMKHMHYTFIEMMIQSCTVGWFFKRITGRA